MSVIHSAYDSLIVTHYLSPVQTGQAFKRLQLFYFLGWFPGAKTCA